MKLEEVTIKNFKAIAETPIQLAPFNVIVGQNGSGKSSVLQALHWVIQSARNMKVDTNKNASDGSTLAPKDATYMPSPDYKNAGNEGIYGNFKNAKRLDLHLQSVLHTDAGSEHHHASLWLKAARNEGVSVHVPSNNEIAATIRNRAREFSAYIPGLAGIPLEEPRHARSIVLRQAAAGDANTVLRNILWLLRQAENATTERPFTELQQRLSSAVRDTTLDVSFDEDRDFTIQASFKTDGMSEARPLELAGIGFLQAMQIFAYIVLFKPRLLLIDEPDSHLHPDAQERLVKEIARAANDHDCQVIMTTHSPNVVRALPDGAKLIWMKDGCVEDNPAQARQRMGWGILDKSLVLATEDQDTDMLQLLLSQWPDLARQVAIWPLAGCGNLPKNVVLEGLSRVLGDIPILLHRDGDMMIAPERDLWREKWGLASHQVWITEGADIEAYFVNATYCSAVTGATVEEMQTLIDAIRPMPLPNDFTKKRSDARELYKNGEPIPGDNDVFVELVAKGPGHVRKKALKTLRGKIQVELKGGRERDVGKVMPGGVELAVDLKNRIEAALKPLK